MDRNELIRAITDLLQQASAEQLNTILRILCGILGKS